MKNKLIGYKVNQVRLNFCNKEAWIRGKKKIKDLKCENCGKQHSDCTGEIAFVSFHDRTNAHTCEECGKHYIGLGAIDLETIIKTRRSEKESLIEAIKALGNYSENYYTKKLKDMVVEKLKELLEKQTALKVISDRIDAIVLSEEDLIIEDYLIKEYHVHQDAKWLKCEEQIKGYFIDDDEGLFDCGQGYYQDEATAIVKIAQKFYEVKITAEIGSSKQDRGDRLYWVEDVEKVTWEEIPKPLPKEKVDYNINLKVTKEQKILLDNYIKKLSL